MPRLPFRLFPIAFLTAIFYLTFVSRIILGPFLPVIERELSLGHGGAGSLFFFIQIGYSAGLLASGFVAWRLNQRRTIAISSIGVGLALLASAHAQSLGTLYACLALVGASAGLYLPTGIATITALAAEAHWGKALALHELAPNLGFISAPLLAEALFALLSWRGVLGMIGVAAVALGIAYWRWGEGGEGRGEPLRAETVRHLVREPAIWVMACLFSLGVGASFGVYSMLPLFLVSEVGFGRATANTITGLSRTSSLGMILVSGWLTDRIGDRRALVLALTATGIVTLLLGLAVDPVLTPVLIFFQSASAVLFFPPAFAAVSRLFPGHKRQIAVSLTSTVGSALGGGLLPPLIGSLAEVASFATAFLLVGLVSILSPLLLFAGDRLRDSAPARRGGA